jgi:hypothetical protein
LSRRPVASMSSGRALDVMKNEVIVCNIGHRIRRSSGVPQEP